MDVIAIHEALVTIWPDGIPREQYVALAGIFKVCGDLEVAALRERVQVEAVAEGDLTKFMNAIPFTHHPDGRKIQNPTHDTLIANRLLHQSPPVSPKGVAGPFVAPVKAQRSPSPGPRKPAARPTTPKIIASRQKRAFVSEETINRVKETLKGGSLRTKEDIARWTKRSLRAVRYALATLQAQGLVKRIQERAGKPHLFQLT